MTNILNRKGGTVGEVPCSWPGGKTMRGIVRELRRNKKAQARCLSTFHALVRVRFIA